MLLVLSAPGCTDLDAHALSRLPNLFIQIMHLQQPFDPLSRRLLPDAYPGLQCTSTSIAHLSAQEYHAQHDTGQTTSTTYIAIDEPYEL